MNSVNVVNLAKISDEEFKKFVNSFDHVVTDIDGTILYGENIIPGADEFILKLRNLGKTIVFATNSGLCSLEQTIKKLKPFKAKQNEIITPFVSVSNFLKSIKFDKDVFVMSGDMEQEAFKNDGFNVVEFEDIDLSKSPDDDSSFENLLQKSSSRFSSKLENIRAVVVSGGIRSSWQKTQFAIDILNKNKNALWICGTTEDAGSVGENHLCIGLKCIIDAIAEHTGREPMILAKPNINLKRSIQHINNYTDSSRVLVIGDSIAGDMGLGATCQFQKLLVLSGTAKKDNLNNWKHPENYVPEYYADSLGVLNFRLKKMVFA